jgi:hypothetical protein
MSNEQQLRDRWGDVFHGTTEYQSALRSDAQQRVARQAAARQAIQTALARGDSRSAAAIQQREMQRAADERLGLGGNKTAGLDSYQNGRMTDYIDLARTRGDAQAAAARSAPLASVVNGPGYYDSLENPDFNNFDPIAHIRSIGAGHPMGNGDPLPPDALANPDVNPKDPTGYHRQMQLNAKNDALATLRAEQHLMTSLPPELLKAYTGYYQTPGQATNQERAAFLAMPPEGQYGKLRTLSYQANPDKSVPGQPQMNQTLPSSKASTPSNTVPSIAAPVASAKITNELVPSASDTPEVSFDRGGVRDVLADVNNNPFA